MIKKSIAVLFLILLPLIIPLANANNPFSGKQENQNIFPRPAFQSKFFLKIIIWQHHLKEKMAALVREAKTTNSIKPLILLIMAAFAYGVIHAAGPGHGKAIALSYVLSQQPAYLSGLLFSSFIALFHGISGIIFVLFIRLVLDTTITGNLERVTHITQIISYSIIICFGLAIFISSICNLLKNKDKSRHDNKRNRKNINPVLSAFVVGCIPCPGVVMVMLFALSMDLLALGIILGLTISIGMAFTISIITLLAISGKVISLNMVKKKGALAISVEHWVKIFAGLALMILGILFLVSSL